MPLNGIQMKTLRDDLRLRGLALSKGWVPELHRVDKDRKAKIFFETPAQIPQFCLQFKLDNKVVWFTGPKGWACAELTKAPEHYVNHRYDEDLERVLLKESR